MESLAPRVFLEHLGIKDREVHWEKQVQRVKGVLKEQEE